MKIGPYTITAIETGEFALDGGAMFGIIPKPLWEKRIPVDARNRIDMRMRALLVRGEVGGKKCIIVIDTGMGNNWSDKERDIYRLDNTRYDLVRGLAQHGVAPESVTDVVLTHLHFDHAGGAVTKQCDDSLRLTFPKATHYVQQTHLAWGQKPTMKDRGSFRACDIEPLVASKQLVTLEGPQEIFAGFRVLLTQGHTTGLQHPVISDGTTTLFYAADLFPTSAHVPVPWIMGYDIRPLITAEEKQTVLAQAVKEHWIIAFEHCPLAVAAYIAQTDKGYALGETVDL